MKIGIIDYGAGNIFNVQSALTQIGYNSIIVNYPDQLNEIDRMIIPGVGSFGTIVKNLNERCLFKPIKELILGGLSALGICLGYQVLFKNSEESNQSKGFDLIDGYVKKLNTQKIPHLGWNFISTVKSDSIFEDCYQYFVHSYYPTVEDESIISTRTNYEIDFASSIEVDNITGCQFHPERSGPIGLKFLRRWVKC